MAHTTNDGKLLLDLDSRIDANGKKYFICRVRAPITISCKEGVAFLIFTSEEGQEQMQISDITEPKK